MFDRRTLFKIATAGVAASAGVMGATSWRHNRRHASIPLHSQAVAFRSLGVQEIVPPDAPARSLVPGYRVWADSPDVDVLVQAEHQWLHDTVPWVHESPWDDLARTALQDLYSLRVQGVSADGTSPVITTVAAWSSKWRYVWPRDTAHVAAALAAVGKLPEAVEQLSFFKGRIRPDGWFEARYQYGAPYTPVVELEAPGAVALGVPDDRPPQLDGAGWLLWSAGQIAAHPGGVEALSSLAPFLSQLIESILLTTSEDLFPVSADYWEVVERRPVLGISAPLLAGLQAVSMLTPELISPSLAQEARSRAETLEREIRRRYGRDGYPRHMGGSKRDTAVAFLLPPYAHVLDADIPMWVERARSEMQRPAGGVAPGVQWTKDGISWTPETAIFGLAAAHGQRKEAAHQELAWLARHRTKMGALPEKVLADHSPAAPAPLAWTAAVVLLTLAQLAADEAGQ